MDFPNKRCYNCVFSEKRNHKYIPVVHLPFTDVASLQSAVTNYFQNVCQRQKPLKMNGLIKTLNIISCESNLQSVEIILNVWNITTRYQYAHL